MISIRLIKIATLFTAVLFSSAASGSELTEGWPVSDNNRLRLNTSINTTGGYVRLGDVFSGFLSRPEKIIAQAPAPGQRMVLSAKWLSDLAHTYGLSWQPTSQYDRAIVYQPGYTIAPEDILEAVRTELIQLGMPKDYGINSYTRLNPVTIAASAPHDIRIREAFFDPTTDTFSAVAEIPPGTPDAQFVMLQGITYPTATIPVLTQNVGKNTVISANMVENAQVRLTDIKRNTITDISYLMGKAPITFLQAGRPITESDVAQITLIEVPVANRSLRRGTLVTEKDVRWVTLKDADLTNDVVVDKAGIIGHITRHNIRPGQIFRDHNVERPTIIQRGALITIVWNVPMMSLSTQGQATEAGGMGDTIRVLNTSSKTAIFAEVIGPQKVRVSSRQTAMR